MWSSQLGQIERRGSTIDLEAGSLYIQTFKKLPMHIPKMKIRITIHKSNMFSVAPS